MGRSGRRFDPSRLGDIAGRAYHAALHCDLWRPLFQDLAEAAGADGVIGFHFGVQDRGSFLCSPSLDASLEAYLDGAWYDRNPRLSQAVRLHTEGRLISDADLVEGMQSEAGRCFRNDFLQRNGLGWFAGTDLHFGSSDWLAVSIERSHRLEPFQADELEVLQRTMAHVMRAAAIAPALDDAAARGLIAGLDEAGRAAALLDRAGRIIVLSQNAERLVAARAIRIRDNTCHLADTAADRRLQAFVASLVRTDIDAERDVAASVVSRHHDGRPLIVRGARIAPVGADVFKRAKAYVTFDLVGDRPSPAERLLREAFGLTPGEARIAQAVAEAREVSEIAALFGVSPETVRSQLKAIYAKTGTRRQAALAVLLSSIPTD